MVSNPVTPKTILISGAGIAGPALALLLSNAGHNPTIVERSADFRAGGQQVDVAGEALKVLRALGIEEACFAHRVHDDGIRFVGADDYEYAAFAASSEAGSLVKELEIMRPDLAKVISEACVVKGLEVVFGEWVTGVKQDGNGVKVTFANGMKDRRFDVLVAADGLRSATRTLAFGDENTRIVTFNQYAGYFSIPWAESDGTWSRWYNVPGGRCICTRPNKTKGLTGAYLCQVTQDAEKVATMSIGEQKREIATRFDDAGWETERILKYLLDPEYDSEKFYCQEVAQTKSEKLVTGRAALLGDAGYCPAPISGQGSSIALIGAYLLAGCIATHEDVEVALREYEKTVRPFADSAQNLAPGVPWVVNPQTGWGIFALNQTLKVADTVAKSGVAGKVSGMLEPVGSWLGGGKELELPEFKAVHSQGVLISRGGVV